MNYNYANASIGMAPSIYAAKTAGQAANSAVQVCGFAQLWATLLTVGLATLMVIIV